MSDQKRKGEPLWLSISALALSVIAVFVTVGIAVVPGWVDDHNRSENAKQYLTLITSSTMNSPLAAQSYTVAKSDADTFASIIQAYWSAVDLGNTKRKDVPPGKVTDQGGGVYKACFPDVSPRIFHSCVTVARFEYDNQGLIRRFTVNNLPVGTTVSVPADPGSTLTADNNEPTDVFGVGSILDVDASQRLVVLHIRRHEHDGEHNNITFTSVQAQDVKEHSVNLVASSFPQTLSYFEDGYAVALVPDTADFLYTCWTPDNAPTLCQWIYRLS